MATSEERSAAHDRAREEYGRYYCRRCADEGNVECGSERYCMGVYAAMICDPHWEGHSLNHDRRFDPADAGEVMEPDEY